MVWAPLTPVLSRWERGKKRQRCLDRAAIPIRVTLSRQVRAASSRLVGSSGGISRPRPLAEKLLNLLDDLVAVLHVGVRHTLIVGRFQLADKPLQLLVLRYLLLQRTPSLECGAGDELVRSLASGKRHEARQPGWIRRGAG